MTHRPTLDGTIHGGSMPTPTPRPFEAVARSLPEEELHPLARDLDKSRPRLPGLRNLRAAVREERLRRSHLHTAVNHCGTVCHLAEVTKDPALQRLGSEARDVLSKAAEAAMDGKLSVGEAAELAHEAWELAQAAESVAGDKGLPARILEAAAAFLPDVWPFKRFKDAHATLDIEDDDDDVQVTPS